MSHQPFSLCYLISSSIIQPNHLLSSTCFRLRKEKDMLKDIWHQDPALYGYKALITKVSAHILDEGWEHVSSTGTVCTVSLYHWHTTQAHLGVAFSMWASATNYSQGNDKTLNRFMRSLRMDPHKYIK